MIPHRQRVWTVGKAPWSNTATSAGVRAELSSDRSCRGRRSRLRRPRRSRRGAISDPDSRHRRRADPGIERWGLGASGSLDKQAGEIITPGWAIDTRAVIQVMLDVVEQREKTLGDRPYIATGQSTGGWPQRTTLYPKKAYVDHGEQACSSRTYRNLQREGSRPGNTRRILRQVTGHRSAGVKTTR